MMKYHEGPLHTNGPSVRGTFLMQADKGHFDALIFCAGTQAAMKTNVGPTSWRQHRRYIAVLVYTNFINSLSPCDAIWF